MSDEIVRAVDPERIVLFGSHARGDARPNSDVDLLIVEREPFTGKRTRVAELKRLWQVLARFLVSKDILVYSAEEVARLSRAPDHVLAQALDEGRTLYERA